MATNLKPGWKTTEFWLNVVAQVAGALMIAGVFPEGSVPHEILGVIIMALGNLGYGISRGLAKANPNALRG